MRRPNYLSLAIIACLLGGCDDDSSWRVVKHCDGFFIAHYVFTDDKGNYRFGLMPNGTNPILKEDINQVCASE